MKRIFIGSSTESLNQAQEIAAFLEGIKHVQPLLWTDVFKVGDITFLSIEEAAEQVAGAVFLATPDDESVIRDEPAKVPRTNVIFEYGYFTARLARNRVALCRYDDIEFPSDFAGITYVPMGAFSRTAQLNHHARAKLRAWANGLPAVQRGLPAVSQVHGYSGQWKGETTFSRWRGIALTNPDYVRLCTTMLLHIPPDGRGGVGCIYGNLQIQIGQCYAEFEVNDRIVEAYVLNDGSMRLRLVAQSRQRITLEGDPPQQDGFEPMLRGAREFGALLKCSDEPGILHGEYITKIGNDVRSQANQLYVRPELSYASTDI